jgi:hypothetical protein
VTGLAEKTWCLILRLFNIITTTRVLRLGKRYECLVNKDLEGDRYELFQGTSIAFAPELRKESAHPG